MVQQIAILLTFAPESVLLHCPLSSGGVSQNMRLNYMLCSHTHNQVQEEREVILKSAEQGQSEKEETKKEVSM